MDGLHDMPPVPKRTPHPNASRAWVKRCGGQGTSGPSLAARDGPRFRPRQSADAGRRAVTCMPPHLAASTGPAPFRAGCTLPIAASTSSRRPPPPARGGVVSRRTRPRWHKRQRLRRGLSLLPSSSSPQQACQFFKSWFLGPFSSLILSRCLALLLSLVLSLKLPARPNTTSTKHQKPILDFTSPIVAGRHPNTNLPALACSKRFPPPQSTLRHL